MNNERGELITFMAIGLAVACAIALVASEPVDEREVFRDPAAEVRDDG